ncbi:MAG: hypothetical protein U0790_00220 [Isosphaeraceae bacterium]
MPNMTSAGPDCGACQGCSGGDPPCTTPACVGLPSYPCYGCRDYSITITGPSPSAAVVYSGPAYLWGSDVWTGGCFGAPILPGPGTYNWSISGWVAGYTPSATSGTFTRTCGGGEGIAMTWSLSDPAAWCPCGINGTAGPCSAYPPLLTVGAKTLTNARGTAVLAPFPASSPLVIHSSGDPDTTYADVWAGTQTITACSVAADCCDRRIEGGAFTPGSYQLFWVMGVKSSGGCFLHCWSMACYCGGAIKLVSGSFDRGGVGMSVDCGGIDAPPCVKKPVMMLKSSSWAALPGGVASPFFYQWSPVFRIPSATFGNILGTSTGGGPCSADLVGIGYHDEYMGLTTVTD